MSRLDSALVAAATLSDRYIQDRFLPDKAIDLLDEACASIRTEMDSMPAELDEATRRVMRLEIEETALKKEKDRASQSRMEELRKELADLRAKTDAMKAQWQNEKRQLDEIRKLREELEAARHACDEAERAYNHEKAAELRYGRIPELEKKLLAKQNQLKKSDGGRTLLHEEVTDEEIAEVVSRWAGIPVTRLLAGERERLLHLGDALKLRVVGQDEAVLAVADAVLRARAGIKQRRRSFSRPHRRRQDRTRPQPRHRTFPFRGQHGSHRHERIHGKTRGFAAGWRAPRLRRLR
jgi:ATP-dependent Clp protease ATP-binding subunit ClpB